MVARAVSARRSRLTPLAVLVPLAATPVVALWALETDPLGVGVVFAVLVFAVGLMTIRVAGRAEYGSAISIGTALITWAVAFLGLPFWFFLSISTSVCGKQIEHGWGWVPPTVGALVFAVVGSWGLRTQRGLWAVPRSARRLRARAGRPGDFGILRDVTPDLDLRSARSITPEERATLFNAAYEGYLLPFHIDEQQLAAMDEAFDLDLDASRVAFRDGEPVGLGNLGVRGEDGWIGGVGVVTAARRSGIGEALMRALHEQARERGIRRVWLEVIVENSGAFALYQKLGYRTVRDVEVWSLPLSVSERTDADDATAEAAHAHARIRELHARREPWQRADGTLANYADARGLVTDEGAAVYRQRGENVQLLQIGGDAEPLLRALRTLGTVSVLNVPEDDPAAAALRALGAAAVVRQHEMLLELAEH